MILSFRHLPDSVWISTKVSLQYYILHLLYTPVGTCQIQYFILEHENPAVARFPFVVSRRSLRGRELIWNDNVASAEGLDYSGGKSEYSVVVDKG